MLSKGNYPRHRLFADSGQVKLMFWVDTFSVSPVLDENIWLLFNFQKSFTSYLVTW